MSSRQYISVPSLHGGPSDWENIVSMWEEAASGTGEVVFGFHDCEIISHEGVAFLGGLVRHLQSNRRLVRADTVSLQANVLLFLSQNRFMTMLGHAAPNESGHTIPFREDLKPDHEEVCRYLRDHWIGRGWVQVSSVLADALVGRMWEIYDNAFTHSDSKIGLFSCGFHDRASNRLSLITMDFGIGIPAKVRAFNGTATMSADSAMRWACRKGTSTLTSLGRGLGLHLLRELVRVNRGRLVITSHDGRAEFGGQADGKPTEAYQTLTKWIPGTTVAIELVCDDRYYCFEDETTAEPLF